MGCRLFLGGFFLVLLQNVLDGFFKNLVLAFAKFDCKDLEFLNEILIHASIVGDFFVHGGRIGKQPD